MQLPPSITQSKDLKRLYDETNIIIAVSVSVQLKFIIAELDGFSLVLSAAREY